MLFRRGNFTTLPVQPFDRNGHASRFDVWDLGFRGVFFCWFVVLFSSSLWHLRAEDGPSHGLSAHQVIEERN